MKIIKSKLGKQKHLTFSTKYVILTVIRIKWRFRIQLEISNFEK